MRQDDPSRRRRERRQGLVRTQKEPERREEESGGEEAARRERQAGGAGRPQLRPQDVAQGHRGGNEEGEEHPCSFAARAEAEAGCNHEACSGKPDSETDGAAESEPVEADRDGERVGDERRKRIDHRTVGRPDALGDDEAENAREREAGDPRGQVVLEIRPLDRNPLARCPGGSKQGQAGPEMQPEGERQRARAGHRARLGEIDVHGEEEADRDEEGDRLDFGAKRGTHERP